MSGVNICGDEGIFIPTKASEGCECGVTVVEAGENVTVNKSGDGYTTKYTVNGKDTIVTAGENINIESSVEDGVTTYKLSTPEVGLYDEDGNAVYTVTTDGRNYTLRYGNKIVFHINIAADMVVDSGDTITADGTEKKGTSDKAESAGLTKGKLYVRLHIANADATKDYVYILASDLGVVYTAGENVTIKDGVISAKDTTYTAGTGVTISNGKISAPLTAGTNISFNTAPDGGYVIYAVDTQTQVKRTTSSTFTVPAKSGLSVSFAVPSGASFVGMRCYSAYLMATNGWIENNTCYCTVANWSDSAITSKVDCIYVLYLQTGA